MKDIRRHVVLVNQQGALSHCFVLPSLRHGKCYSTAFGAGSWLCQTEVLIISLQQHLVIVLKLVNKFIEMSEHDSALSLCSHSIITLTRLSELYRFLVRYPLG